MFIALQHYSHSFQLSVWPRPAESVINPGNIDYHASNAWQGQLGIEVGVPKSLGLPALDTPENGIRALGKLLQTYQTKYGLNTVESIIARWAPSNENDTTAYVRAAEQKTGTTPNACVNLKNSMFYSASSRRSSITRMGADPYPDSVIAEGVREHYMSLSAIILLVVAIGKLSLAQSSAIHQQVLWSQGGRTEGRCPSRPASSWYLFMYICAWFFA